MDMLLDEIVRKSLVGLLLLNVLCHYMVATRLARLFLINEMNEITNTTMIEVTTIEEK